MNNIAMAQAVQAAVKPKFRGHKVLKSKVVTYFPENLARDYERIAKAYMTLLNKSLAKHLPTIRRALDAERDGMRRDGNQEFNRYVRQTLLQIEQEFEKKAEIFGLERRLTNLANQSRKMSISEWKRVVHKTLGININDDYYRGEFYRNTLRQWTANNVNLISSIKDKTLTRMTNIVQNGYYLGKSNTAIGDEIAEAYSMERNHARFIARDQMAKLNADLTAQQQEDAGVSEYIWSTSGDVRVRDSHEALDGTRQKWSDPPVVDEKTKRRCHPGQDYNCRCVALPVFNLPGLNLPWEKGKEQ